MKTMSKRNTFRIVWALSGITFMIWNWYNYQAKDINANVFQGSESVTVVEDDNLISFHSNKLPRREFIFFPGGFVDPLAYAPMARVLSNEGLTVHIVKMPWRLAKFGYNKINDLFNFEDTNCTFILGGHSQGAKMAAQYIFENPNQIDGLILLGTSHPRDFDLSYSGIPTVKLYAENDGLASIGEVIENQFKLPKNTNLVLINGGNHSQFGNLGELLGDDSASISREEQQQIVIKHILALAMNLPIQLPVD